MNALEMYRQLLDFASEKDVVKVPESFREQAVEIDKFLKTDPSGITNSLLDLMIKAALVDYKYTASKTSVADNLNYKMDMLNEDLIGKIPTGLRAFAEQYFLECWKGSSLIVINVIWKTDEEGVVYPANMYVLKGRDIFVETSSDKISLGGERYYFTDKNGKKGSEIKEVPGKNSIFICKPVTSWADNYPVPFLISRGIYKNSMILDKYISKGTQVVSRAISLLMLKKGNVDLAKTGNPNYVYDKADLDNAGKNLTNIIEEARREGKTALYTTNFDTELDQLIPKLTDAVSGEIYAPAEKRILNGFGIIDVGTSMGNGREQAFLNPKGFIATITNGIETFERLLKDVALVATKLNKEKQTKNFIRDLTLDVSSGSVNEFLTNELMGHFRNLYDRGILSRRTYAELNGNGYVDLTREVNRKREEKPEDNLFFPPVIQNNGQLSTKSTPTTPIATKDATKPVEDTNKGPVDAPNFVRASKETAVYETVDDLPNNLDVLPKTAKKLWMEVFNQSVSDEESEDISRRIAWSVVKQTYKKDETTGKWKRKEKSSIMKETVSSEIEAKTLENLDLQNKILKQHAGEK